MGGAYRRLTAYHRPTVLTYSLVLQPIIAVGGAYRPLREPMVLPRLAAYEGC